MANLNRKRTRLNETKCIEFIYHIFFLYSFNTPNAKLSEKHQIKTKKEAEENLAEGIDETRGPLDVLAVLSSSTQSVFGQ